MATAHIACREHFGHVGSVAADGFGAGFGITARVFVNGKAIEQSRNGVNETHGQQNEVCFDDFFAASDFHHLAVFPFHAHGFDTGDLAFFANEFFGGNGELALQQTFFSALVVAGTGT